MAGGIIGLAAVAAYFGIAHIGEPDQGGGSIAGQVQIAPNLADQVKPTDVLFVIVRRPTGPPRPIAAKRIDGPKFPVQFEITNDELNGVGLDYAFNLEEACVTPARLPDDRGRLPNEYPDLCTPVAQPLVSASSVDTEPTTFLAQRSAMRSTDELLFGLEYDAGDWKTDLGTLPYDPSPVSAALAILSNCETLLSVTSQNSALSMRTASSPRFGSSAPSGNQALAALLNSARFSASSSTSAARPATET